MLMWSRADADPQASPTPGPSPTAATSQSLDTPADFDAPLLPRLWFSLEDQVTANYDDVRGSSNTLNVRGQIPLGQLGQYLSPLLAPGNLQLIKFKIPFVTSAPNDAVTGNGDTTLVALEYLGAKARKWVVGPVLKIPTASETDLGSGRWSIGPAGGFTYSNGSTVIGLYAQTYFSFAGPKSRGPVSQTQFQPGLTFSLPGGWSVGTSEMQFTYNWVNNTWQNVPLGICIARRLQNSHHQLVMGLEAEKNLAPVRTTTVWTFRMNLKYRLLH
jgi:hypothetical protein